ncbi:MAG: divalent-cation tolerance protein CutA [Burkholderiaceae bacterium]
MATMEEAILVLTNMPDAQSAHVLARRLVELKIAACVNILPGVQSVYRWQGEIEEASEMTVMIKTTRARYVEIESAIKASHPYQVPEIIALPIVEGLPDYLDWIAQETKKDVNV